MSTQQLSEGIAVLTQPIPSHAHQTSTEQEKPNNRVTDLRKSSLEQPVKSLPAQDTFISSQNELENESLTTTTYTKIEENTQKNFESLIDSIINTSVEFTVDDEASSSYIKITDKATNELLRTIPSEAMRKVLDSIHDHIDDLLNESMDENRGHILDTNS